jgi:hypothetical protein
MSVPCPALVGLGFCLAGSTDGERADAPAQEGLQLAEEGVASQRSARVGAHQAIALDRQPVPGRLLGQQLQIHPPVVVDEEEEILPVVAPLYDMMGTTGHNCPFCPWHSTNLHTPQPPVNHEIGDCPYYSYYSQGPRSADTQVHASTPSMFPSWKSTQP